MPKLPDRVKGNSWQSLGEDVGSNFGIAGYPNRHINLSSGGVSELSLYSKVVLDMWLAVCGDCCFHCANFANISKVARLQSKITLPVHRLLAVSIRSLRQLIIPLSPPNYAPRAWPVGRPAFALRIVEAQIDRRDRPNAEWSIGQRHPAASPKRKYA
jgi:hypothetical protein